MENFNDFKKAHYKQNTCVMTEGGVINFNPDSLSEVVGAEKMTYDEYLDVQISSLGKTRSYFELCLLNHVIEFKGQIERINKGNVCFKRIYISGMYPDGTMFDGREVHVWMDRKGFEDLRVGDSVSFFAEVYRYVKTSNGKQIDYSLRNPESIKKIPSYELPTDKELKMQSKISDNIHSFSGLGNSEILAVKHLPCDIVPQFRKRSEDGRKRPAAVMR